jgi:hypothetical protein
MACGPWKITEINFMHVTKVGGVINIYKTFFMYFSKLDCLKWWSSKWATKRSATKQNTIFYSTKTNRVSGDTKRPEVV